MSRRKIEDTETLRMENDHLRAEVEKWKSAYRELALAAVQKQHEGASPKGLSPEGEAWFKKGELSVTERALPTNVLTAIEETTGAYTPERNAAIEAARALLENGVKPDDVEIQLRKGDEIVV